MYFPQHQPIVGEMFQHEWIRKVNHNRILSEIEVLYGIKIAQAGLCEQSSDRMITVGGNCTVSLAPFTCLSR